MNTLVPYNINLLKLKIFIKLFQKMEDNEVMKQKWFFYIINEKLAIIKYYNRFNSSKER